MSTTDLKSLSDADLDSLIEHGISQQETVPRHGDQYQHLLNVVATAKEEKARRAAGGETHGNTYADNKKITDGIKDDKVEESPLSTAAHENLELTPDATKKDIKDAKVEKDPQQVVPGSGNDVPAENLNKGMKGVTSQAAKDTPETPSK